YPLSGLPAPDADGGSALELQVALRPPGSAPADIQTLVGASYLDALRARLVDAGYDVSLLTNDPAGAQPAVGPPVYGQLAVGPGVLAARSTAARPLDAAVPLDTIDVLNAPSTVWGTAAAATILARLDPTVNQAGMTAAQLASRLDSMSQLATVGFITAAQA